MAVKSGIKAYLKYRGAGIGEEHAVYVYNSEICDLYPRKVCVLKRFRELSGDKTHKAVIKKVWQKDDTYKVWFLENGQGKEGQGVMPMSGIPLKPHDEGQSVSPNPTDRQDEGMRQGELW